jgi:hypothetical protein
LSQYFGLTTRASVVPWVLVQHIVRYVCLQTGFGWGIASIAHLQVVTATTAHNKSSQSRRFLVTGFSSGDSSPSTDN